MRTTICSLAIAILVGLFAAPAAMACDPGLDCYHIDLKGLLQLACDVNTGDGCDFRSELDKLKELAFRGSPGGKGELTLAHVIRLACDLSTGDGCDFNRNLPGSTVVASASKPETKFMAPNRNPTTGTPRMEKRAGSPDPDAMARIAAASPEDFPLLMKFLSKKININGQDPNGLTLLIWASAQGRTDAVKYLLSKGADPTCKSKSGCTPLACAKNKGHKEVVKILEEAGAK